jgi:aminopeptidase N
MFEQWIGPDVFRQGVNEYLRAHAWKNAVAGDLWESLGKVSGKDVPAAMAGYIDQQGLPLVGVQLVPGGQAKFSQKRFLNYGVKADPLLWSIPVSFKWSDGSKVHTEQIFMIGESATFTPKGGKVVWVMPNVDGRGYYRWSAPQDMMLRLSREATTAMNPAERIAFLGNAQALLQAGEIRGDSYLRLLAAFSDDPDPLVAAAVLDGLGSAQDAFVPDDLRDAFGAYVRSTLSPMAKRFGLEKKAGEAEVVSLMRPRLFAWLGDEGNDPAALSLATRIANDYMADPAKPDPSMVGTALQLTTMHGDRALFDRYRKAFEEAKTPSARQRYLAALGAVRDPALQDEALRYVLEGPVRVNEMRYITAGIRQQSDRAHDKVFAWLRANYAKVTAKIPEEFQASLPFYANGCSQERIAIAQEFFSDPKHRVQGTEKELAQVVEEVGDCVGLRQREGAAVATYLRGLAAGGSKTAKSGSP